MQGLCWAEPGSPGVLSPGRWLWAAGAPFHPAAGSLLAVSMMWDDNWVWMSRGPVVTSELEKKWGCFPPRAKPCASVQRKQQKGFGSAPG